MKALKWIGIVIVGLIILGFLLPDSNNGEAIKETESATVEDLEVIKSSETANENLRTVHVELKNNTDKLLTSGLIEIVYEDKNGNIVGTGNGSILNLAAGATKVIDCLAMDVVNSATYKVQVTPLTYH
jgi:hypothetical protein